jgi:hypothetical protein
MLSFAIAATGRVTEISVGKLGNRTLAQCWRQAVRTVRFPAKPATTKVKVRMSASPR